MQITFDINNLTSKERKVLRYLAELTEQNEISAVELVNESDEPGTASLIQKYNPEEEFEVSTKTLASVFGWKFPKQFSHRIQHLRAVAPFMRNAPTPGRFYLKKAFFKEHLRTEDYGKILRDVELNNPVFLSTYDLNKKSKELKMGMRFQPSKSKKCHKARVLGFKGQGSKKIIYMNTSDWRDSNPELWWKLCT